MKREEWFSICPCSSGTCRELIAWLTKSLLKQSSGVLISVAGHIIPNWKRSKQEGRKKTTTLQWTSILFTTDVFTYVIDGCWLDCYWSVSWGVLKHSICLISCMHNDWEQGHHFRFTFCWSPLERLFRELPYQFWYLIPFLHNSYFHI